MIHADTYGNGKHMKYSEAKQGRTFVIRLEDGEILHETLEQFAREHDIKAASLMLIGGADKGSILVVGPEESRAASITPMEHVLEDAHEITGVGTIFPDRHGDPVSHIHISCGRKDRPVTGCTRRGVKVWHVMEVVLTELLGTEAQRLYEEESGFELLNP